MKKPDKESLSYIIFDEFWGPHSIFSVLSFVIGGILVGRTVWEYLFPAVGPFFTICIGLILISLGGIVLHKFDD